VHLMKILTTMCESSRWQFYLPAFSYTIVLVVSMKTLSNSYHSLLILLNTFRSRLEELRKRLIQKNMHNIFQALCGLSETSHCNCLTLNRSPSQVRNTWRRLSETKRAFQNQWSKKIALEDYLKVFSKSETVAP